MKNLLLSVLSGILLAISWPTYGLPIFIFVAFVPLLFVEHNIRTTVKNTKMRVFGLAFTTFLIWNLITTGWLYYASFFGMVFAILFNTVIMSLVFLMYHISAKRLTQKWSLAFLVSLWLSFEYLHLHWDFSWPWLNLGNVFSENITWIQWRKSLDIANQCVCILRTRSRKKNQTNSSENGFVYWDSDCDFVDYF
jgi:apolipoprotein N-acyltransferase